MPTKALTQTLLAGSALGVLLTLPASAEVLDTLVEYGNAAVANPTSAGAGIARGFTNPAADQYTITAGGTDFWDVSDHGSFIYDADQTQAGDFSAYVRVDNIGQPGEVLPGEWGRAGLMARGGDPTAANGAYAATIRRFGTGANGSGIALQQRAAIAGGTSNPTNERYDGPGGAATSPMTPVHLSLTRFGGTWYSSWAPDVAGAPGTWTAPATLGVSADQSGALSVGLAHQNHSVQPEISTATFSGFSVSAPNANLMGGLPEGSLAPNQHPGGVVRGSAAAINPVSGGAVSTANWRVLTVSNPQPGLVAQLYTGSGNPGSQGGAFNVINNNAPTGTAIIPNVGWFGGDDNDINYFGLTGQASFGVAVQGTDPASNAAGAFSGNEENYGVHMFGEIFISPDGERMGADANQVLFKDGIDDYTYLNIDGNTLIDDNNWTGRFGNDNGGSPIVSLDVSDPKFDDGEWVSFQMVMWEGGGGDNGTLFTDMADANANFPGANNVAANAEDLVSPDNFRYFATVNGDVSGTDMIVDGVFPGTSYLAGQRVALFIDGRLVGTVPEPSAVAFLGLSGLALILRRRRR
jgi:hypothetical protein